MKRGRNISLREVAKVILLPFFTRSPLRGSVGQGLSWLEGMGDSEFFFHCSSKDQRASHLLTCG